MWYWLKVLVLLLVIYVLKVSKKWLVWKLMLIMFVWYEKGGCVVYVNCCILVCVIRFGRLKFLMRKGVCVVCYDWWLLFCDVVIRKVWCILFLVIICIVNGGILCRFCLKVRMLCLFNLILFSWLLNFYVVIRVIFYLFNILNVWNN